MGNMDVLSMNFPQICSLTGITDFILINHADYGKRPGGPGGGPGVGPP